MAGLMYAGDYDETLPLYRYLPPSNIFWSGGRPSASAPFDKSLGLIVPYIKSGEIQRCPSYTGGENLGGSGYGMNSRLAFGKSTAGTPLTFGTPLPAAMAELAQPTETIFFGEAGIPDFPVRGMVGETIQIDPPGSGGSPTIDFRHQRFANFVYCDGHIKPVKQEAFTAPLPTTEQDATLQIKYVGDKLMARR
jgi:prepilin-type processing-associated H-X9-DG protein